MLHFIRYIIIDSADFINTYLLNGGSSELAVNGSSTPVEFTHTAVGYQVIGRMLLYLSASTAMQDTEFGDLTALSNGVDIVANGVVIANWKDNIDILTMMFDYMNAGKEFGKDGRVLAGRWTLYKAHDSSDGIGLAHGEVFKAVVNDNLAGLDLFRIRVQGDIL